MKIALIIFRIGPSHGSILQTYALYKSLVCMGHQVTVVNRQPCYGVINTLINCMSRLKNRIIKGYKGPVFYIGEYSSQSMIEINRFVDNYIGKDLVTLKSSKDLQNIVHCGYDAYIVGSDQTWRPKYVYDIFYYFLDFLPLNNKALRIAYAPSFGVDDWEYNTKQTSICKELAQHFNAISVREQTGVLLCRKYLEVDAKFVLDPTMLLEREDYDMLISAKQKGDEHFIACSVLDDTDFSNEVLNNFSDALEIPLKRINRNLGSSNKQIRLFEPAIEDWLAGIRDADFVVTDSFHATVFSIIYNRPFVTLGNNSRGLSRLSSLLELCGLKHRLITDKFIDVESLIHEPIDWGRVNNIINNNRELSVNFLKESLANKIGR